MWERIKCRDIEQIKKLILSQLYSAPLTTPFNVSLICLTRDRVRCSVD
jgi:hypothetical protein